MSCMTSADALFWNGAAVGSVALGAADRWRARRMGITRARRRADADVATANLLSSMGLDPHEVLGPDHTAA